MIELDGPEDVAPEWPEWPTPCGITLVESYPVDGCVYELGYVEEGAVADVHIGSRGESLVDNSSPSMFWAVVAGGVVGDSRDGAFSVAASALLADGRA